MDKNEVEAKPRKWNLKKYFSLLLQAAVVAGQRK